MSKILSFASKHNTSGKIFDFTIPEHFEYSKLIDMVEQYGIDTIHPVNALYVSKGGNYGPQPVLATNKELVNIPAHLLETFKEIMADKDSVETINKGKVGFKIYRYENNKGIQHSMEWVDK